MASRQRTAPRLKQRYHKLYNRDTRCVADLAQPELRASHELVAINQDATDASHGPLGRENAPHLLPGRLQDLQLAHACLQALARAGPRRAEGLPLLPLLLKLVKEKVIGNIALLKADNNANGWQNE